MLSTTSNKMRRTEWFIISSIVLFGLFNICCCDIEPKPNYDEITSMPTKIGNELDDTSSIDNNNHNNNNNNVNSNVNNNVKSSLPIADLGFIHAFVASLSVILVSELGDKTFFIAAIMAMRHPRLTVFTGAISALALMTILSAVFGMAATIIPRVYTYYISTALFAIFGLKMLKDGYYMSPTDAQEELEEVQSDLRKREDELIKSMKTHGSTSGLDSNHNNSSRGSNLSIRSLRGKDDNYKKKKNNSSSHEDDDDDIDNDVNEQTRSMLNGLNERHVHDQLLSTSSNKVLDVRSHSAINLGGTDGGGSNSSSGKIKNNTNRYSLELTTFGQQQQIQQTSQSSSSQAKPHHLSSISPTSSSSSAVVSGGLLITNGDINSNGMELKQLGSKKRLEKDVSNSLVQDAESGVLRKNKQRSALYLASRIFMQAFTMTFLAEWGDRSQLTTIILSAREDVYGVIVGGVLGHSLCTGLAVIGGRMIAQKISVRTVTLIGGVVFILFAISALFFNPNEEEEST